MRRFLLASAIAAMLSAPLTAQTTVSSGTSPNYFGPLGIDSQGFPASAIAQTFVTPSGMNYLQSFSFYLSNSFNGNLLFLQAAVYQFNVDQIAGPSLFASALFNGSGNVIGNDTFTFGNSLNVALAPNTVYALVLSAIPGAAQTPDGSTVLANLAPGDTYAPGALFYALSTNAADLSAPGGFSALDGTTDVAFSATFTPTTTPEPATLMLVATGFAGLGGVVARRRRKS
jgi:PEP-CTERM motif